MRKMYSKKQIEEIAKSSGTKLYKHFLRDSSVDYNFTLITTNPQTIDFSIIDTYEKLYNYLLTQNIIQFTEKYGNCIQYDNVTMIFYSIKKTNTTPLISEFDDWSLNQTTDTVSPL